MKTALSIILPCYNESGNLHRIFSRFREILETRSDVEVLFVNNGSTDDSAAVFATALQEPAHASFARLLNVPVNQGYGYGIMAGVRAAGGEVNAWTHADLQTDPADVLVAHTIFLSQSNHNQCFIKGRRRNRPLLDTVFTCGMSLFSSMALGRSLNDINAQPKMFHRSFLSQMPHPPDDFSLDLYALCMAKEAGMTILEHPVTFGKRLQGDAKGGCTLKGKIRLIRRTWSYILRLRREIRQRGC